MTALVGTARGEDIADQIELRAQEIRLVLSDIAGADSIAHEISDAVQLLRTATIEGPRYERADRTTPIRVYLPANNVLYSLALFALMPGLYMDDVLARPSSRSKSQYFALMDILGDCVQSTTRLGDYTQRQFAELAGGAVVIFNGRPDNGRRLAADLPSSTMLGFGAGPNPVVVGPRCSDLEAAAAQIIAARLYNNGEDCLCPDVAFVHESVRQSFLDAIVAAAQRVEATADRSAPGVVNGPLSGVQACHAVAAQLVAVPGRQLWKGPSVDHACHHPIVLRTRTIDQISATDICEYFGPVLDIATYTAFREVRDYLHTPRRLADGMYVWGFGEPGVTESSRIGTSRSIGALTPFEAESGHEPFGGWGPQASWVMHRGRGPIGRPLLLSAELPLARPRAIQPGWAR